MHTNPRRTALIDTPPPRDVHWDQVHAAQRGDNDAFGRLYTAHRPLIHRYVRLRVGDHALAEDLTSETFLRAYRRIHTVRYQGRDIGAWFVTIARNLVHDHAKAAAHRLEVPTAEPDDTTDRHHPGPEDHVIGEADRRELLRCVRRLNPDQRECIRLRFLRELSVRETATRMRRNEAAVKALQHRAIRRLGVLLREHSAA